MRITISPSAGIRALQGCLHCFFCSFDLQLPDQPQHCVYTGFHLGDKGFSSRAQGKPQAEGTAPHFTSTQPALTCGVNISSPPGF